LNSDYVGEGYGVPSEDGESALKELWQCEGILLDPVYTAKAMAGLIDLAPRGKWINHRIVFLHTGGIPAVFALPAQNLAR
jgi:1-aminocyclopropane-1-carboxylate deaminase/D-cysteine desulfhydrase-like pyridoxal-dependent ACC family enzyme